MMASPEDRLPRPQIHRFLAGLAHTTGLRVSLSPPSGMEEDFISGDPAFCLLLRSTQYGNLLCLDSHRSLVSAARGRQEPVFDLCYARMGQAAVPFRAGWEEAGTVKVCGALLHGLSGEHRDFLLSLARDIGLSDPSALARAAAENRSCSRAQLTAMAGFMREQMEEKITSSVSLEETTELFLRKYEELMFLYAITENLTPEMEYHKVLSVILDKGLQKVSARSGLFLLVGPEGMADLQALVAYGDPLLPEGSKAVPAPFADFLAAASGPLLLTRADGLGFIPGAAAAPMLVHPFRIKNLQTGYLILAPVPLGGLQEDGFRFMVALANQAATILHNAHLYREISSLLFSTLEALSTAIDAKDAYTHGHSKRVAEYAVTTAQAMGFGGKALTRMKIAGLLHDFGKVIVGRQILVKSSSLSLLEKDAMEQHTVVGAQILAKLKAFSDIIPGIRHHHERYDGKGYPDGLKGEEIPLEARILAVADAYDAMVTSRPYRQRLVGPKAHAELTANAGTQFDPEVVKAFVAAQRTRGHERT